MFVGFPIRRLSENKTATSALDQLAAKVVIALIKWDFQLWWLESCRLIRPKHWHGPSRRIPNQEVDTLTRIRQAEERRLTFADDWRLRYWIKQHRPLNKPKYNLVESYG